MLIKFAVNDMYRSDTGSVMPNPPSLAGRRIRKYAAVGLSVEHPVLRWDGIWWVTRLGGLFAGRRRVLVRGQGCGGIGLEFCV